MPDQTSAPTGAIDLMAALRASLEPARAAREARRLMADQTPAPVEWRQITCAERDELYQAGVDGWRVLGSLTDLSGTHGDPTIFTEWRAEDGTPILRDRRWPQFSGERPDARPCEHYVPAEEMTTDGEH